MSWPTVDKTNSEALMKLELLDNVKSKYNAVWTHSEAEWPTKWNGQHRVNPPARRKFGPDRRKCTCTFPSRGRAHLECQADLLISELLQRCLVHMQKNLISTFWATYARQSGRMSSNMCQNVKQNVAPVMPQNWQRNDRMFEWQNDWWVAAENKGWQTDIAADS